jgi:PAS domain S-box-containing protein
MKFFRLTVFSIFFIFITINSAFSLDSVTVELNWRYQFEFAGYIAAKEKGFYKKAGLNVKLIEYDGGSVQDDVLSGKYNFGITDSDVFASIILNKPIVLLANFFKRSPLVLAVKPDIITPEDLKDKTVMANENEFKFTSLGLLFQKFKIKPKDIKIENTTSLKLFSNSKVDAMAIYLTNQPFIFNKLNVKYNIIDPVNYGIFTYAGNLVTSKTVLKQKPKVVKRFVDATIQGWRYALTHKKELVNIIYNKYSKAKSKDALMFEANAIEKVMMPKAFSIGSIDMGVVQDIVRNFEEIMKIGNQFINLKSFIYNPGFLTKEELKFIKSHKTIRICTNTDWKPIEYVDNGIAKGMSIAVLDKISKMTDIKFKWVKTSSWIESQEFLKEKKCDLLPATVKTSTREKYARFTNPYMRYELFIFAKNDKHFVNGIGSLVNKIMVRKKGSGVIVKLKKLYPNIKIKQTDSYKEDFEMLEKNRAYYTVCTLPVADYYIRKYGYKNIVIIGDTGLGYNLSMAVRDDMPVLVDILNGELKKIKKTDLDKIYSIQLNTIAKDSYNRSIMKIMAIVTVVVIVMFGVIYIINKKNRELLRIKKQLEDSIDSYKTIRDIIMQGLIVYDNGVCVDVNYSVCNLLGYDKNEIIGKKMEDLVSKKSFTIIKEKLLEEHTEPYEVEFIKKDGTVMETLAKGDYVTINSKKVRVGSIVDITRIKQLENRLKKINELLQYKVKKEVEKSRQKDYAMIQQAKLASMGELLSMIAHQWRQPINTISATVNSILLRIEMKNYDEKYLKEKLDNIYEYLKYLSETIDDFRDFFRPDKQKEKICIDNVITNMLKIASDNIEKYNIKIELNENCKTEIETYANELKQVILNLVNNAKDVLIERRVNNPTITIYTHQKGDGVDIVVLDNAGGIDEDKLDKIFEPYFSTKSKKDGTGLGLYMSKMIVEEHLGGKLLVKNTDSGAEFKIILPMNI